MGIKKITRFLLTEMFNHPMGKRSGLFQICGIPRDFLKLDIRFNQKGIIVQKARDRGLTLLISYGKNEKFLSLRIFLPENSWFR